MEDIKVVWEIVKTGGVSGVLFIVNILLWIKIDKKEKEITELTKILTKNTILQSQSNQLLQKVSDNLIQLIGSIKR